MKSSSLLLSFMLFIVGFLLGYATFNIQNDILPQNIVRSNSKLGGFYRVFDYYKRNHSIDLLRNKENNTFDYYGMYNLFKNLFSEDKTKYSWFGVKGLAYCNFIAENEMDLPKRIDGTFGYVQLGDKIFYDGKLITTTSDYKVSQDIPGLFYDGKQTFYNDSILSGFDYANAKVLDFSMGLYTDGLSTYYQNFLISGFDNSSFDIVNKANNIFRDKNMTYQAGFKDGNPIVTIVSGSIQ